MNLSLTNNLFNNIKDNEAAQSFIKELSNHLENSSIRDNKWNNLISEDLTLYNKKIITKYRNKMLIERNNILQNYAEITKEAGEMYYIYNTSANEKNAYNLCICNANRSNEVITKQIEELPEDATLGSVLRNQNGKFILDIEATKNIEEKINIMIKEQIKEQDKYLNSKRIDGHVYEAQEKHIGRIWLYDLNKTKGEAIEGIEEIEFPKNLYDTAKQGDLFIYKNGEYEKLAKQ